MVLDYQSGGGAEFCVDNISGHHMSITKDGAADGFLKEYTGCHNGGDSSYTHWRFV